MHNDGLGKELLEHCKGAMKLCRELIEWEQLSSNVAHMLQARAKHPRTCDAYLGRTGLFLTTTKHHTLH
jgi:hypothetical protein